MKTAIRLIIILLVVLNLGGPQVHGQDFVSYSHVMDDGSLLVSRQKIWLYGIMIPLNDRTCRIYQIPIKCGQRALLALEFKIEPYFVSCDKVEQHQDGSITALCQVQGEDLSAWMLEQGWAAALPGAPPEYQVLEKIARQNFRGIWGRVTGPP